MPLRLLSYPDSPTWLEAGLELLRLSLDDARPRGRARFCLAGGSTPRPLYEAFAAGPDPRLPLLLAPGDERLVAEGSPERNGTMIAEAFGPAIRGPAAWRPAPSLLPWPAGEEPESEALAESYAAKLDSIRAEGGEPLFDLVLLGLGADGHCAGIFPGDGRAWAEAGPLALPGLAPLPPRARLSLSPTALVSTRRLAFLVRGAGKSAALEALRRGGSGLPAELLIDRYLAVPQSASFRREAPIILYCQEG